MFLFTVVNLILKAGVQVGVVTQVLLIQVEAKGKP